ncbi:uncharacterized protein si:ch211-188c16.1 isoform X3 [Gadus macrocephalus]|uniref:uncharacterized protein si:ch211-188c16.1 isoform X3 n=1 Tax=Gadus macrocephalus TaxID=80720 RepID=UPI0028CB3336|nr:uncharacterized protein si:ch211-188c16.1 isoform X3 [Gadus macrocephalus]
MEQDGPTNFKALRAKFQEEAALAQARNSRPTIAEKPRNVHPPSGQCSSVPPPGGHCRSVLTELHSAVENGTQVVPRVIFRSELRASGGMRPISFPPQTSLRTRTRNGDDNMAPPTAARHSVLEGHLPLVLPPPPPPMKEHQLHPVASTKEPKQLMEPPLETLPSTRTKRKGLLLPFKASKSSKGPTAGEECAPAASLTNSRPASVPGELPSLQGQDEAPCPRGADGQLPSPDVTPPSRDTSGDSDSRIMSTLERAKRKFSRKHMLLSCKASSLPSTDEVTPATTTGRATLGKTASMLSKAVATSEANFPVPSPVFLPDLACVSARPFFKVGTTSHKTGFDQQLCRDRYGLPRGRADGPPQPPAPPRRSLLDMAVLGPVPAKPPRPPCVDLFFYFPARDLSPPPVEDLVHDQSTANATLLDAPDFPDFDHSVSRAPDAHQPIDIASLEVEALEFVDFDLPPPIDPELYFEALLECEPADPLTFDLQALNLDSQEDSVAQEPSSLPEAPDLCALLGPVAPESWCGQGRMGTPEPPPVPEHGSTAAGEAHPGASEAGSSPEEAVRARHAALANWIESQPSSPQLDGYHGTCENLYEDVETINGYLSGQNSRTLKEHKGGPKNPYADSNQVKEESRLNIWPRNPWGSRSGEHSHSVHPHFQRDRQSPDHNEHKDQKKRERQRQEKEKKEQKEKEKRETEMKKKFKVTGEEEPLYHAKVMVASKVHKKNDLTVTSGDMVSIIRTNSCPKGRWLARDANLKYGYISVMNVELNIQEMLELGKTAQAARRESNMEADTISIGSRSSNYPVLTSSYDSEEWAFEDETLSHPNESHSFHQQTTLPEMMCSHPSALHTLSDANLEDLHTQTRHEALQKLATFFQQNKEDYGIVKGNGGDTPTNEDQPSKSALTGFSPYHSSLFLIHLPHISTVMLPSVGCRVG